MADSANVHSLEQLQEYLEKSKHFRTQLLRLVEDLRLEVRRLTDWIEGDATRYWEMELQQNRRKLSEAQDALTRCMSYVREDERQPCTEQKKHVYLAQNRRAVCEEKLRLARAASKAWSREVVKNSAKIQRIHEMADADLTVMIHHLQDQVEKLAEYVSVMSPALAASKKASAASDATSDSDSDSENEVDHETD